MEISPAMASRIIREVNAVQALKINIMNRKGVIIASSDPSRVGQFHAAAAQIIREDLDEIIVRHDAEFAGAIEGVNYPLRLADDVLGVLGITGAYQTILSHSLIIKRLTELLLLNEDRLQQRYLGEQVRNRYLAHWLKLGSKAEEAQFQARGLALGIDIKRPRRMLYLSVGAQESPEDLAGQRAMEAAERRLLAALREEDRHNLYYKESAAMVLAVTERSDAALLRFCEKLHALAAPLSLRLGISQEGSTASQAYQEAQRAYRSCPEKQQMFYSELGLALLLDTVAEDEVLRFIRQVFGSHDLELLAERLDFLSMYYAKKGRLQEVAKACYLHRNTVQYHLQKIAKDCGRDPRDLEDALYFQLALALCRKRRREAKVGPGL